MRTAGGVGGDGGGEWLRLALELQQRRRQLDELLCSLKPQSRREQWQLLEVAILTAPAVPRVGPSLWLPWLPLRPSV